MKLFFICIGDFFKYLFSKGTKQEWKRFLYSFNQITFITLFAVITAPLIWNIYYLSRNRLYHKIGANLDEYEDISIFDKAKHQLNCFEYFIFLYGDKYSPCCTKLPEFFEKRYHNKSNYIKWFLFSAIRNPFFNYHYKYMLSKNLINKTSEIKVVIDERTNEIIYSDGITPFQKGKYLIWRKDIDGNPYFLYRNNNKKYFIYFEYCGLETLYNYNELQCRLEMGIRKYENHI